MRKYITAILLLLPLSANAITGNELLKLISSDTVYDQMEAMRYVQGAADQEFLMNAMAGEKNLANVKHCIPESVTLGQLLDVIKKHLESNPADRHFIASLEIYKAFIAAWPC